jgi:uncharacterized repeat protein (TIGR01451 family)
MPVNGYGVVVCSCSAPFVLGISSPEEAEIQLIALFRFPEPALTHPVTTFVPNADLSLGKNITGGSPNPPTLNQTFSYELVPANNGNVPLDSLVMTDTLPVEMNVASVTTGAYNNLSDFAPGVGVRVSLREEHRTRRVHAVG